MATIAPSHGRPAGASSLSGRSATALTALAALAVGVAIGWTTPRYGTLLVVFIAAVIIVPVGWRVSRGRFDPFEPYFMFVLAFTTMFVVRPAGMIAENRFVWRTAMVNVEPYFERMLIIALIGATAFVVGYHVDAGKRLAARLPRPAAESSTEALALAALATAVVGVALYSVFLLSLGQGLSGLRFIFAGRSIELTQDVSGSTAYFTYGYLMLIPATLLLFGLWWDTRRRLLLYASLGTLAALLVIAGPTGSRGSMLPLFGGVIVFTYVSRGKRPRTSTLVLGLFCALLFSYVILNARDSYAETRNVGTLTINAVQDPSIIFEPILHGPDVEMADALAASLSVVPSEFPYRYGAATIGDLFIRPIPRSLWPGKPLPPREQVVQRLTPQRYALGVANPEFSAMLTMVRDFGIFGPLLLGFYGLLGRTVYEWMRIDPKPLMTRLLFALAVPFTVLALRDSFVDTFMRSVFIVGPLFLAFAFSRSELFTRAADSQLAARVRRLEERRSTTSLGRA